MSEKPESGQESLKVLAERAGFKLSDAEAKRLAEGQQRNREMADSVRKVISREIEPASVFRAGVEKE